MGVAVGLSNPVKAALIAEIYGVERLGAVRSLFTMVMVLSTALGPMMVGNLLDLGFSFKSIVLLLLAFAFLIIINGFRLRSN
jgi:MFS family permease